MSMFCYQCEQTAQGTGCTSIGICGKTPETATLQDVMVYIVKGVSQYAHRLRALGIDDPTVDAVTLESLFMTLTNVNFDEAEHVAYINEKLTPTLAKTKSLYLAACKSQGVEPEKLVGPAEWSGAKSTTELNQFGIAIGILERLKGTSPDIVSLQELLTYGVKGLAAYAHHALLLGFTDVSIAAYVHKAFSYLTSADQTIDQLLALCLEAGKINYIVMQLLDHAHTESFGNPEPTSVRITPVKGKAILVSGHDLKSLYELLKQTEGKGINVYTHGEVLPAHGYPGLKKFKHLVGHYGTAWQNQVKEFEAFPGAIVMTTNCLKPPADTYIKRLFSMDVVGWHGVNKLKNYDFSKVIDAALAAPGFTADEPGKEIMVGFGHAAVLGVAPKVIDLVKAGKISHFYLIGGCDGAEFSRNYFTEFAESVPADGVILTLGCGKFRFNYEDFGAIDGIPRLLDIGQCNDAYSAIQIATALAGAFNCDINELPLSLIISWFEQKAVAVLLTLLSLGVKNIRLGPNLPAFVTPTVLQVLVDSYGLKPVGTVKKDMEAILQKA
ncbi:MAG TPA: hydroxylamine reductase [Drouetiella sp.]|jgi:hydroxylamine reductase